MSLADLLAKTKQTTAAAPAAPVTQKPAPTALAISAPTPAHMATEMLPNDKELVGRFRKSMDHLSAALADPKYAITVADAVRDIGMTIREHPHLNTLIEPQDFANLVRVIRESAQYKARATAETKNTRAVKAGAKADLEAAFNDTFSLDGLSGGESFDDTQKAPKPAPKIAPPSQTAGINLSALLAKKKG